MQEPGQGPRPRGSSAPLLAHQGTFARTQAGQTASLLLRLERTPWLCSRGLLHPRPGGRPRQADPARRGGNVQGGATPHARPLPARLPSAGRPRRAGVGRACSAGWGRPICFSRACSQVYRLKQEEMRRARGRPLLLKCLLPRAPAHCRSCGACCQTRARSTREKVRWRAASPRGGRGPSRHCLHSPCSGYAWPFLMWVGIARALVARHAPCGAAQRVRPPPPAPTCRGRQRD